MVGHDRDVAGPGTQDSGNVGLPAKASRAEAPASPAGAAGGDAPPTNRASQSYGDDGKANRARILRMGVDSLYLSFKGELDPMVEFALAEKKQLAQSRRREHQTEAQYPVLGHLFEVKAGRDRLFPYVLEDGSFRISLASSDSRQLPFAYVKISSDLLAHKAPEAARDELVDVLDELAGEYERFPTVSRVDVFVDFQTSVDLGELRREAWITRAGAIDAYARDGRFSGWAIGAGSPMSARLYDKTLEIKQKRHKPYLVELWRRAGRDPNRPVWRLEFELKREVLDQLGIHGFKGMMDYLGGIWGYATQAWLRLAMPQAGDTNRGRWPTHPLWDQLASIRWRLDDVPLVRKYSPARVPSEETLFRLAIAVRTSFMAVHAMTDWREGFRAFDEKCEQFLRARCTQTLSTTLEKWIELEARTKGRLFNSLRNVASAKEEAGRSEEEDFDAIEYEKRSRGE